jgi:hypothetical protein
MYRRVHSFLVGATRTTDLETYTRRITVARSLPPLKMGMNHGRQAPYATPLRRRSAVRSPVLSDTSTQQGGRCQTGVVSA